MSPTDVAPLDTTADSTPYRITWDDFSDGFLTSGPEARWTYLTAGPFIADDGIVTTSTKGLRVVSRGTNPYTGEPAFVHTVSQEDDNGSGLPGSLDHIKWLVYANHQASSGYQGFDAVPGHELSGETWISGRTYGTERHPFGGGVRNPDDDLRLASVAVSVSDPETSIVFDFFVTNKKIYAFYERLPEARATLGNYAAFSAMIPVAQRFSPVDQHHLKSCYDQARGVARWLVDDKEVHRVDRLGYRPARKYLTLDHGGVETLVKPRQLNFGMGLFSLLDGSLPGYPEPGLVLLSNASSFYFSPLIGEPTAQSFLDEESLLSNRLFGQGAEMCMSRYVISSVPIDQK